MKTILFTGTTLLKQIHHHEYPKVEAEVTPHMVIRDGVDEWGLPTLQMGLLLHCQPVKFLEDNTDGTGVLTEFELFSGRSAKLDPVRWWRAIQLVEAMPSIKSIILPASLFIATGRHPHELVCYLENMLQGVLQRLDSEHSYTEIMARPVPLSVIQIALDMAQGVLKDKLEDDSITDEIEAGTIRWSQDLKRIGVVHPDYRRAKIQIKESIATRYTRYLSSYAAFMDYSYTGNPYENSYMMNCVEWRLYASIERDIEQSYGPDVTFLLSTLVEKCEFDEIETELQEEHPVEEIAHRFPLPTREQHAETLVTWFLHTFSHECITGDRITRTREAYLELLDRLHSHWQDLPITHLLVS